MDDNKQLLPTDEMIRAELEKFLGRPIDQLPEGAVTVMNPSPELVHMLEANSAFQQFLTHTCNAVLFSMQRQGIPLPYAFYPLMYGMVTIGYRLGMTRRQCDELDRIIFGKSPEVEKPKKGRKKKNED